MSRRAERSLTARLRGVALASAVVGALSAAVVGAVLGAIARADAAAAQDGGRSVVVVSDSIAQGAQAALESKFGDAGWTVTVDAARNRTTQAGPSILEGHRSELTDTLVLSLGANDGVGPAAFRSRVDAVMAVAADVPRVLWLNLHEVRDGYAQVNQVLREAAASHPNLQVLDWHSIVSTTGGLTASDRLHLTPAGGAAMADLIVGSATVAPMPTTTVAPTTVAPTTVPATTASPTTASPQTAPPGDAAHAAPTTGAAAPTANAGHPPGGPDAARRGASGAVRGREGAGGSGWSSLMGWTFAGFLAVIASLGVVGMCIGAWSLWSTRHGSRSDTQQS